MNLRLQHVTISRPPGGDAAARTFYGSVLGLTEVAPPRSLAALDLIWYRLAGETELHILVEEPMGQDHTGRHFCLAVDDVVELRARLDAAGITTVGDTPIPGWLLLRARSVWQSDRDHQHRGRLPAAGGLTLAASSAGDRPSLSVSTWRGAAATARAGR